jgi:hypothetical protein
MEVFAFEEAPQLASAAESGKIEQLKEGGITVVELHPEFLVKDGKKQFVVPTIEEFEALQEVLADAEDLLELRTAKAEEAEAGSMSLDDAKKLFGMA